jgi:uncharacterized protein
LAAHEHAIEPQSQLSDGRPPVEERLRRSIDHAAHLLPAQGPIAIFIHHNTLHAFEDRPFEQAVADGAAVFGCQPYLRMERYREALRKGRIRFADLLAVLEDELGLGAVEGVARLVNRLDLRLAMLQYPLRIGPAAELQWFVAETDALRRVRPEVSTTTRGKLIAETRRWVMRDLRGGNEQKGRPTWLSSLFARFPEAEIETWSDETWEAFALEALWSICLDGVRGVPQSTPQLPTPTRHRDLLLAVADVDVDLDVNALLIRFCATFLDQGLGHWSLPEREKGIFRSFCSLYRRPGGPPNRWLRGLPGELARLQDSGFAPIESILESLSALGVTETEWDEFLSATLLSLRGWGGIIRHTEERPDRVTTPTPAGSLHEFVAVRLLLERLALAQAAKERLGYSGPLAALRDFLRARLGTRVPPAVEERAFPIFQLAQLIGWSPDELHHRTPSEWGALVREVEGFTHTERRRVFHLAYEARFRVQTLDALALHAPRTVSVPRFQVVACIDEREESFRRHLEEVARDCETFGIAGFFGVAMYYRGAGDAHAIPLCPVVIRPRHWVEERVEEGEQDVDQRARLVRRALGRASHRLHVGTRTFALGAVLSAGLGVLASIPLVARVLFPGLTARFSRRAGEFVRPRAGTRLHLERTDSSPGPRGGGVGFTVREMADIAERVLRDIGLTRNFARLILFLGHGSHSMNNPHESAHDCGACGGAVGGPNGRAIAQMLNDARVRAILAERGLTIPADTVFVGGLHNTCNEYVKFADTDRIPQSHRKLFDEAKEAIEAALDRNAHERCRRFDSAPLTISFAGARQHLDNRAEDLAQVRPEWGHATNAVCVVGRRERTRGLFFDRRAFLNSYDPTQDDEDATILTRTLQAVFPVCGGINLEYYFSHVDNQGYGCGTKLPHNITSLLGVMDGAASDLRTGLPWQMVEIHEPVRLMLVCEVKAEVMLRVLERNPMMMRMVAGRWVHLAVLDPYSQKVKVFRDGVFHDYRPEARRLPQAASSIDWYRGWRDYLEFAEIGGK